MLFWSAFMMCTFPVQPAASTRQYLTINLSQRARFPSYWQRAKRSLWVCQKTRALLIMKLINLKGRILYWPDLYALEALPVHPLLPGSGACCPSSYLGNRAVRHAWAKALLSKYWIYSRGTCIHFPESSVSEYHDPPSCHASKAHVVQWQQCVSVIYFQACAQNITCIFAAKR